MEEQIDNPQKSESFMIMIQFESWIRIEVEKVFIIYSMDKLF